MGLRDRFDAVADAVATVVSSVFVTGTDHPNRGGITGDRAPEEEDDRDGAGSPADEEGQ